MGCYDLPAMISQEWRFGERLPRAVPNLPRGFQIIGFSPGCLDAAPDPVHISSQRVISTTADPQQT